MLCSISGTPAYEIFTTVADYNLAEIGIYNFGTDNADNIITEIVTMVTNGQYKGTNSVAPNDGKKFEINKIDYTPTVNK